MSGPTFVPQEVATPAETRLGVVLFGPPGSGKGTQAEALCRRFNLVHVATGDLFRQHLQQGSNLGCEAKAFLDRGELVPDEVTIAMLRERLRLLDRQGGFVLDGFPRTLPQAEALDRFLAGWGVGLFSVIHLKVRDATILDRLTGRRTCVNCQAPYHLQFKRPLQAGCCDLCSGRLDQRVDDVPETVRHRLATFHAQTEPLLRYYQYQGSLIEIDGEQSPAKVRLRVAMSVRRLLGGKSLWHGQSIPAQAPACR